VKKVVAFLRERAGVGDGKPAMLEGGASFAYVFGKVLVFLLLVECLTGVALSAFYSPSATDAWGSVAYIQDQSAGGWLVRGLHHHGGGAIVVVAGIHLLQTAAAGAYKKPRELVWWLGVVLLLLVLAWAVTGYVLRWDQAGYWANRVELGIAAGTPVIGGTIKDLALGGNDYGNLTLTRFYTLHVIALPALVIALTAFHIWLARKHGTTPVRDKPAVPRFPDQAIRDALAMALTLAILLGYVVMNDGVELAAPADPSSTFDARPLWYFRWLYELRELSGSAEKIVALVVPGVVAGFLVMLPLLDKAPLVVGKPRQGRTVWLGGLAGLFAIIGALTVMSFRRDSNDDELAARTAIAAKQGTRARELARKFGVPATGAQDIWLTPPMTKARRLFDQKCAGCHVDPKDRKGPLIAPGHGNRAWIKAFLLAPGGDEFWGRTKLEKDSKAALACEEKKAAAGGAPKPDDAKADPKKDLKPDAKKDAKPDAKDAKPDAKKDDCPKDLAMKPVDLKDPQLDQLVEYLYAMTGATDADKAKVGEGAKIFQSTCTDCHTVADGTAGGSGPNLLGLGSRDFYTSFIGNPKKAIHMTEDMSEMPRFDKELTLIERDLLAEYLVWLRTASKADLDTLGPP
jgi:ubiquinol-cytochrome c reductase cytochrome b subunit